MVIVLSLPVSPTDTVPTGVPPAKICVSPLIAIEAVPTTSFVFALLPRATELSMIAVALEPIATVYSPVALAV